MVDWEEPAVDLAGLVVPLAGQLVATGDRWEPYRLLDSRGIPVEAARAYFGHLQAAGRSELTIWSYGLDLLRWFRFVWAAGVAWDQVTRAEAREFCRWLVVAGKPVRPHWRERRPGPEVLGLSSGQAYAPSVRAHCETVLRSFYDFHVEAGTGPLVNPFPLDRSRRAGRAHAHHNPMEPYRNQRSGLYRPVVPSRVPRNVPDEEFNTIFAALGSHRDRALVAFYVSTGARASELLSATRSGVDPGRQLITVARKGTRAVQQLPASADAFVWLRLYQVQMDGLPPRGAGCRCGGRCGGRSGRWAITRCTACSSGPPRWRAPTRRCTRCGIPRPTGWLPIRRCRSPTCSSCSGHALLTTTQLYLTPRKEEVIRRVLAHHSEQVRQARQRARPAPAPVTGAETLDVLFGQQTS